MSEMYGHFSTLASSYNDVRTTDPEPVEHIARELANGQAPTALDVGCGGGRYDLLLLRQIPGLRLTCSDVNEAMLAEAARYLRSHGHSGFSTLCGDVSALDLAPESLDCVLTFNAIHHFDPVALLDKAARALRADGRIFVYTRLASQNARSLWGRLFPGFARKEDRLYDLGQVERWSEQADGVALRSVELYRFARSSSLETVLRQARKKHYSTLALYADDELEEAVAAFEQAIRREHPDPEQLRWTDENVLLTFVRTG